MKKYLKPLFTILFFFCMLLANAQLSTKKANYAVNVSNKDETIKAFILSDSKKISTDPELTYYWYAANKIIETKGGYDGKLLYGEYISFYLDNNLKEKGRFIDGLKNGKWTLWYPKGKIKEICYWKNGIKDGACKSFNEKEELLVSANYREGKLHGKMISYEAGKVISEKKYKNGIEILPKEKSKTPNTHEWRKKVMKKKKVCLEKIKKLIKGKKKDDNLSPIEIK